MVTPRDQLALDFIQTFKMVTPKQVSKEVYGDLTITNNRLKQLVKDKVLYRAKNGYDGGYVYATAPIKSTRQYRHYKARTDFYQELKARGAEFARIDIERQFGSVKPDATFEYKYKGNNYFILLEVELRCGQVDYAKYNQFFIKEYLEYFNYKPLVVYVTDKAVAGNKYAYIKINTDFSNMRLLG